MPSGRVLAHSVPGEGREDSGAVPRTALSAHGQRELLSGAHVPRPRPDAHGARSPPFLATAQSTFWFPGKHTDAVTAAALSPGPLLRGPARASQPRGNQTLVSVEW